MSISREVAEQLLDFGSRIGAGRRAEEQLDGAVAIHNLLEAQGVAYLADEVGMGKTYVTLGAIALFRHFNPDFRVLFLAPRANIQQKWQNEHRAFVRNNIRFSDLRNRAPDGRPAWPSQHCERVIDLLRDGVAAANRDFFCRLTSFSLAFSGEGDEADPRLPAEVRKQLPWLPREVFSNRKKELFKDNFAKALCCGLPEFDLVVVDEAHNLKHGYGENVATRNRILGLAMGRAPLDVSEQRLFRGYGRRATRVLFLSATPVEDTYRHLWNQLDVFGVAEPFNDLKSDDEQKAHEAAKRFLIRRVTQVEVGSKTLTRNLYRSEWRQGGVDHHDEPVAVHDDRQRLVLALVQKKVAELLGHERFGGAFQMGMLASFESFQQTLSGTAVEQSAQEGTFDGADQTQDAAVRDGVDVQSINDLSRSYKAAFRSEMPHPKMDAVAASLSDAWRTGEKALVFVRRVASVKELKGKLDDAYDTWLLGRLRSTLPRSATGQLEVVIDQYRRERRREVDDASAAVARRAETADRGGRDTFFAWFFRGEGPKGVLSGASMQSRFMHRAVVFDDNSLSWILQAPPAALPGRVCEALGMSLERLEERLSQGLLAFLSDAKKIKRDERFLAVQAAACELLRDAGDPVVSARARVVWHTRWESRLNPVQRSRSAEAAAVRSTGLASVLKQATFFDALAEAPALRDRLWPDPIGEDLDAIYRERFLRAQMLASAARLGHGLIDVYEEVIARVGTLSPGRLEAEDDSDGPALNLAQLLSELLERQMRQEVSERGWGLFDELAQIADHFGLIQDTNLRDVKELNLNEAAAAFGRLLGQQRPVAGMSGRVTQTPIQQFRMPGYPFVLITTDVLQEGEDLHTFCSRVHHYGISWTPSSMEQRTGRIDRVRSKTDRRLQSLAELELERDEMLQVHFPYLQGTVEVLQVRRVLQRMDRFVRLMHEGLKTPEEKDSRIVVGDEIHAAGNMPTQPKEVLRTAFPIRPELLSGKRKKLIVSRSQIDVVVGRFERLTRGKLGKFEVTWEPSTQAGQRMGTVALGARVQPITLLLGAVQGRPILRCISPVGRVYPSSRLERLEELTRSKPIKVGLIVTESPGSYDLTVQDEVLLGDQDQTARLRAAALIGRVVHHADALENQILGGVDALLEQFRTDLSRETLADEA